MTSDRQPDEIARIAAALLSGKVAIIPTDTVYGIAASLGQPDAIEQIYDIKGRPNDKPIPILVDSLQSALELSREFPEGARRLAAAFWPGALTIIVPAAASVPARCLGPGASVGLRLPDHPATVELLRRCGGALAVTSANLSGQPETTRAEIASATLGISTVLDRGETPGGVASTVVDMTGPEPRILRHGAIVEASIRERLSS